MGIRSTFAFFTVIAFVTACDNGSRSTGPNPGSNLNQTVTPTPTEPTQNPTSAPIQEALILSPATLQAVEIQQYAEQNVALSLTNSSNQTIDYSLQFIKVEEPHLSTVNAQIQAENLTYLEVKKGMIDPRKGQTRILGSGGPDDFGYEWLDSLDPQGPNFDWVDISATGTLVEGLGDDVVTDEIPIGFSFPFYENDFSHLRVSSNGYISFDSIDNSGCCSGQAIPNVDSNNHLIAWMWTDLDPQNGSVYYQSLVDGRFVLQFEGYGVFGEPSTINAQVVLYQNGDILLQYLSFTEGANETFVSIGIENEDGTDGLQVALSDNYLQAELSVLISHRVAKWVEADTTQGTLAAGESQPINLRYRGDRELGSYQAQLQIWSASDVAPLVDIPISLEVGADTTPPEAVTDFSAEKISYSDVVLSWTAIANSKVFGGALNHYEIRYSTQLISEESWNDALIFNQILSPAVAGENESLRVTGLTPETQYYFALRAYDQANNASALSNIVQASTLAPPVASIDIDALSLNLEEGNTDSITVTLKNIGDADLLVKLKIEEEDEESVSTAEGSNQHFANKITLRNRITEKTSLKLSSNKVQMKTLPTAESFSEKELIVRFVSEVPAVERDAILQQFNATKIKTIPALDIQVWKIVSQESMLQTIQSLNNNPAIVYAEPNYKLTTNALTNDPEFPQLWGLQNLGQTGGSSGADIDATSAWDHEQGNEEVIVAVIDTGIDYLHPDLADNMWVNEDEIAGNDIDDDGNGFVDDVYGYDFYNDDGDPMDDNNHGTHCAGTIGARGDNGEGVVGVNHRVRLMSVKFLGGWGGGGTDDAVEAIIYAVDNGAHILSNSWGGGAFSNALLNAIEYANENDVLFVAAAGNSGSDNDLFPNFPSNHELDNVVAVAASDHNDDLASFSQFGATTVDLAAPGVDIFSTVIGEAYTAYSGTSMAAPHVAGVAALIKAYNSRVSALEIKEILLASTEPVDTLTGLILSGGRLNAKQALDFTGPPWISLPDQELTPISGGAELEMEFGINSVNVEVGDYEADIVIETNDPENPQLVIPVSLSIRDDGVAPAAVSDLAATDTDERSTFFRFTASGDDGTEGKAHRYDLRYSFSEITDENWQNAFPLSHNTRPQESGLSEIIPVGGLPAVSTIWVAVRAVDFGGLESELSNVINLTTLNAELEITPETPPTISVTQGEIYPLTMTLSNVGEVDLNIKLDLKGNASGETQGTSYVVMSREIDKGERDYRVGAPTIYDQGGPDEFSNRWVDSNEAGGPVFEWNDISNTGVELTGLLDDIVLGAVELGFEFPFYGDFQSEIYISSNGFIGFDNSVDSGCCTGQPLPGADRINHLIAWLWYDLHPQSGSVFYELVEPGRFVLQFNNYGEWAADGTIDAQIILESDGRITIHYTGIENNMQVTRASIGIENQDGSDGLQVAFNTEYVENDLALTFFPGWFSMDTNQLTLVPGQSEEINFTIDSTSLDPGHYTNSIRVISNDLVEPEKIIDLELEVREP